MPRPYRVAVIATPPVSMFNLAVPEMIFEKAEVDGVPGYETTICAPEPGPVATTGGLDIQVRHGLEAVLRADTVIIAGAGLRQDFDPRTLDAIRTAATAGKRIAAICSGAFLLAEAGLLDGRPVTTHWQNGEELTRRYPSVSLQSDVLYVQDGRILTASGYAASLDLCLHIVRTDHGAAIANEVARRALVAPVRPGGQAQSTDTPLPPERGVSFAETRAWIMQHLDEPLTLSDLARHAGVSIRTLSRRFLAETGVSPLQWLLHQRIERARELLETTKLPMDRVAAASGLGTADSMRRHLARRTGLTPSAYRTSFSRLATVR
ncbi:MULTISPECIES: helix-turn-helix domain-containing protein [unclassified Streptomyces]|uniref:GlxA family transcriptional regulator n=1 Tax=unclassified Streptomyces TaxID=2593676 RepID=UPI002E101638|nr:helix-turn-helix domain-containing protein [Streptomyces sp. NBC_01197]WSS48402.1 helix-turn-helix domain-containing protein [Streptomyces sp. NBC_01180]